MHNMNKCSPQCKDLYYLDHRNNHYIHRNYSQDYIHRGGLPTGHNPQRSCILRSQRVSREPISVLVQQTRLLRGYTNERQYMPYHPLTLLWTRA